METHGLQLCSVGNPAEGGRKRRAGNVAEQDGDFGSAAAAAVMAGA